MRSIAIAVYPGPCQQFVQLLFAGDHILPQITPNVSYHVQSGDNPLGDYLYALRKLQNTPVTKVLPAHEHLFADLPGRMSRRYSGITTGALELSKVIPITTL